MKQRNGILVSYEDIHEMLGLSDDYEIVGTFSEPRDHIHSRLQVIVRGDRCTETPEGCALEFVTVEELAIRAKT